MGLEKDNGIIRSRNSRKNVARKVAIFTFSWKKKIVRAMRHRSVCICQVLPYITKTCYSFIYYYDHHYNYYHYRLNAKARIFGNKCHQIGVCVLLKILMLQCSARSNSSRLLLLALGRDAYQEFCLCWRRSCPHLCPYVSKEELSNWSAWFFFCFAFFFHSIASNKFITRAGILWSAFAMSVSSIITSY